MPGHHHLRARLLRGRRRVGHQQIQGARTQRVQQRDEAAGGGDQLWPQIVRADRTESTRVPRRLPSSDTRRQPRSRPGRPHRKRRTDLLRRGTEIGSRIGRCPVSAAARSGDDSRVEAPSRPTVASQPCTSTANTNHRVPRRRTRTASRPSWYETTPNKGGTCCATASSSSTTVAASCQTATSPTRQRTPSPHSPDTRQESAMRQIQIRTKPRPAPQPVDLRTPSGRLLPY
jgi:hypothetical protein